MTQARGNAVASAETSAPVTSAGAAGLAERLRQLVPAPHVLALRLDLAPRADDRPAEQPEHDERGDARSRRARAISARRARGEDGARRPVDHERPARRLASWRRRRRDRSPPSRPSTPDFTPSPCLISRNERHVLRLREVREGQLLPGAVEHDEPARSPRPIVRLLAGPRGFELRARRRARRSTLPLASCVGTAMMTTCRLPTPRGQAVADVRLARRDHAA